jgi:hypothetical protein
VLASRPSGRAARARTRRRRQSSTP